jgi:hypothetical protein
MTRTSPFAATPFAALVKQAAPLAGSLVRERRVKLAQTVR